MGRGEDERQGLLARRQYLDRRFNGGSLFQAAFHDSELRRNLPGLSSPKTPRICATPRAGQAFASDALLVAKSAKHR
jgi:hypothetical protein